MTLTEFLLARIADDEARVREWQGFVADGTGDVDDGLDALATVGAARVLAECEAKRRIVEEHAPRVVRPIVDIYDDECQTCHGSEPGTYPCITLRALALPYADDPDYRDEWKP